MTIEKAIETNTDVSFIKRHGSYCKIKAFFGARQKITNCGFGSLLFIKDLKKFYRQKSWLAKKFWKLLGF